MATVRIQQNILENKVDAFSVESGVSIETLIREHTDGNTYSSTLVECYDLETGKTYFAPIEDDSTSLNAIVQVNGKDEGLDYTVKENDIVAIVITPASGGGNNGASFEVGWNWWGALSGALTGAFMGFIYGGGVPGLLVGLVSGFVVGGLVVGSTLATVNSMKAKDIQSKSGIDSQKLPDVRGAANQPLLDQAYPFVIGKHLVAPFIIGSPWNEISGAHGETNYIHILYAVGYAPLRITDLKLGDMFLAHNQRWADSPDMKNIFHGTLTGTDIVNTWSNNDITVEILQQGQNGGTVEYGNVYPYAKIQRDINANSLYIADGSLEEIDRGKTITYKGLGLKNGLRNNPIRFTEQFAKSAKVELDFNNGLYKSRSETNTSAETSEQKYYKIPMWVAIQWRVYSEENETTDGNVSGELPLPTYDPVTKTYLSAQRGWNSFTRINNTINVSTYTSNERNSDISAHTGNKLTASDINNGWLNANVFNLQSLGGTNNEKDGINEFRCCTEVDFVEWARENLLTNEERVSADVEQILADKFKAYFYDGSNTTKSIEVRVIRVSPCYLDEIVSNKDHSAFKFNDVFSWTTLTCEVIDGNKLTQQNKIVQMRPIAEDRMRKLCVISLKAKTDNVDQLTNTIKKFSCIAQSFSPYYDNESKHWVPERVAKIKKYFRPTVKVDKNGNRGEAAVVPPFTWEPGEEITEQQFYEDRQNGIKSTCVPAGNDFVPQIVNNVIRINSHKDNKGRYYIPYDDKENGSYKPDCDGTLNYCKNIVSSMFILAGIGPHLGIDALGYEQNFYSSGEIKKDIGDFYLPALAKWNEELKCVKDGSYYTSDGYHYDENGERVHHVAGEEVEMYFTANAYIYQAEMLETVLAKIAIAGRAIYTRDSKGRITVIMDKPEKYPVALINQQNTLKSSYTLSFEELPSGLQMTFPDENDGYEQNSFYCMRDGEDADSPKGAIEQYHFDYVTNNYQQNSLGNYLLANRILNREVVTKQLGIEGASIGLGNLVLVSDDTMLIGTDTGARITQLIEDDERIYGFLINNTYKYTGETEEVDSVVKCKQGVMIMQPSQYKEYKVITLRLADTSKVVTLNGVNYQLVKGNTNVVLFDIAIVKTRDAEDGDFYYYKPEVENLVSFGIVGKITATYRVIKIKGNNNHTFDFTLSKYQEDLYTSGRALPSFQNNMTEINRSNEDSFALSENATYNDLIKTITESTDQAARMIQTVIDGSVDIGNPDDITELSAIAKQDRISISWNPLGNGLNNSIKCYHVEIKKGSADWVALSPSTANTTEYIFNRDTDGYPERSVLDTWKIRVKAENIYEKVAENWAVEDVNISSYGTWTPATHSFTRKEAEEGGIVFEWNDAVGQSSKQLYGTNTYEVKVYYDGTLKATLSNIKGNSVVYNFSRDGFDGYPEKTAVTGAKLLSKYTATIKVVNSSGKTSTESTKQSIVSTNYKTWKPASITNLKEVCEKDSISLSWNCDNSNVYGTVQYKIYKNDTVIATVSDCSFVYYFNRSVGEYPEISDFSTASWTFKVEAVNESPYTSYTNPSSIDTSKYLSWLPAVPVISSESIGRTVSINIKRDESYWGWDRFEVQVSNDNSNWYATYTGSGDPKTDEDLWKGTKNADTDVFGREFNQQLPLSGQSASTGAVATTYYYRMRAVTLTHDANGTVKTNNSSWCTAITTVARPTEVYDLVNNAITTEKLQNNAVTTAKISDDAITEDKIVDNAITTTKITDDAVTTAKVAANAITADEIASNAVTAVKINAGAVTTAKLASSAVTADKIQANTITAEKLNAVAVNKINSFTGNDTVVGSLKNKTVQGWTIPNTNDTRQIATDSVTNIKCLKITSGDQDTIYSDYFEVKPDEILKLSVTLDNSANSSWKLYLGLKPVSYSSISGATGSTYMQSTYNKTTGKWSAWTRVGNAYFIGALGKKRVSFSTYICGCDIKVDDLPSPSISDPSLTVNAFRCFTVSEASGSANTNYNKASLRFGFASGSGTYSAGYLIAPLVTSVTHRGTIIAEDIKTESLSSITANLGDVATGSIASATTSAGVPDPNNSKVFIDSKSGEEEFYIGNVAKSSASETTDSHEFLHFWKDSSTYKLVMKISNFIVTSVASIIRGVFKVTAKDANKTEVLVVTPNDTTPANSTTEIKGKLIVGKGADSGNKIVLRGTTVGTNSFADTNPKLEFHNRDDSQNLSLTFTDYDTVQKPSSLTLNGNQGDEYFIAPNIKATGGFYGTLQGNAYEAKLNWGGKNHSGGFGPLDAALVSELGANRYAGINPSGVTIEYSRDGGSTWTSYGATNKAIKNLFTNTSSFVIGKADSTNKATANGTNYQLRITIDHPTASVYTDLKKYVIYVSTSGSASSTVDIQRALKESPDTFANYLTGIALSGWSGYNVIQTNFTAGNSFNGQYRKIRFIFKANGGDTQYVGLSILGIYAFGGVGWTTPSTLAKTGRLYSINVDDSGNLDATFPHNLSANKFIGALQGDVTGSLHGKSDTTTMIETIDSESLLPVTSKKLFDAFMWKDITSAVTMTTDSTIFTATVDACYLQNNFIRLQFTVACSRQTGTIYHPSLKLSSSLFELNEISNGRYYLTSGGSWSGSNNNTTYIDSLIINVNSSDGYNMRIWRGPYERTWSDQQTLRYEVVIPVCQLAEIPKYAGLTYEGAYCSTAGGTQAKVASFAGYTYHEGDCFTVTFTNTNTYNGAITLNVNSTGAKALWIDGIASSSTNKTIPAGIYSCRSYNGHYDISVTNTNASFASKAGTLTNVLPESLGGTGKTSLANVTVGKATKADSADTATKSNDGCPIGAIMAFYWPAQSGSRPSGWLRCEGQTFSESDYPILYQRLGTNVLPDLRECVLVGSGQSARPSSELATHDFYTVGQFKDDQMQSHTHSGNGLVSGRIHNGRGNGKNQTIDSINTPNTGGVYSARTGSTTHGKQFGIVWCIKADS